MNQQAKYKLRDEHLDQLVGRVLERCNQDAADTIVQFSKMYCSALHPDELRNRNGEDVYALTLAAWNFLKDGHALEPRIRIYNPDIEQHGWKSNYTVVEVIAQDSPFLVDSIRMELVGLGLNLHFINHIVLTVQRDAQQEIVAIGSADAEIEGGCHEAVMYFEIDKITERQRLKILEAEIKKTLADVRMAITDFSGMLRQLHDLRQSIVDEANADPDEKKETIDFIDWLASEHFTFLGFKAYKVASTGDSDHASTLQADESSSLGIIKSNKGIDILDGVDTLQDKSRLIFAKSGSKSRVHRSVYFDLILIRQFDDAGQCVSESRILGLFTSRVYVNSVKNIPVLRQKLSQVAQCSEFSKGGHNYKAVADVVENLPKDELFQMDQTSLQETVLGIVHIQDQPEVRAFFRADRFNRFVTALVYTPRDQYSTALREKFQDVLCEHFAVDDLEFYTHFSQSSLARAHFILRLQHGESGRIEAETLEDQLRLATRTWDDDFRDALFEVRGEELGMEQYHTFIKAFPSSYKESFSARSAVSSIAKILELKAGASICMSFYQALEDSKNCYRIKLYRADQPFSFSHVLGVLQNLGLEVESMSPYEIRASKGESYYFYDFSVSYLGQANDSAGFVLEEVRDSFQEAFEKIWSGSCENDGFNKLILGAGLEWRQVMMLRGYAKYLKQIGFTLSQRYIEQSLVNNTVIAQDLVELFSDRLNPERQIGNDHREQKVISRINAALESVESLDEDRIIRRYLDVMSATIRTNFFSLSSSGQLKDYVSFKIDSNSIPDMPKPVPKYEIYVYSCFMEGVHLRGGKVARGGLRWSERQEDFRTEVLGLVKAQQVKNAVIVPVGAKGGFVAKRVTDKTQNDVAQREVLQSYKTFIRGLLDITDNLVDGAVVKPQRVVCKDDDDPYLVVAADKGTANFSDTANEISHEYNHWLGDAFASGGSIGYNHKVMGITARGAWVAVQRHFRELGLNVQSQEFSVIGIGDMSGDVFGNGMLLSPMIKLQAAFDWRYIFIDPSPDLKTSFAERQRLFEVPRSSWKDYKQELISAGGGVFLRSQKSIKVSTQMKACFDITADTLTPNELIVELLKAPVDLIWNGGVGTYIKSSDETHAMVGDKTNDSVRVNGCEVRAKVVGEGGNLGLTQLGRVEYSKVGGVCNTDFIDNSAGVDCSDNEVNIKILLDDIVSNGDMTSKQRNELLADMTDEVTQLVLKNNYKQNQALSIALFESAQRIEEYKRFIGFLEERGKLDRQIEFLPSDEELMDRKNHGLSIYRPELATLFCYCKSHLKEKLIKSDLPDDPHIRANIRAVFPQVLTERFPEQVANHKLQREIIATQIANTLVNFMGITFVTRMLDATGASEAQIARGFIIASDIFDLPKVWSEIEALDNKVVSDTQLQLMSEFSLLVRRATRWFLRNRRCEPSFGNEVGVFKDGVAKVLENISDLIMGARLKSWETKHDKYLELGFSENLARIGASCNSFLPILGIIEVANISRRPVEDVAAIYFKVGDLLDLSWVSTKIDELRAENHWQTVAREAYRDDLEWHQRTITLVVLQMNQGEPLEETAKSWMKDQKHLVNRWKSMIVSIRALDGNDFSMFSVAIRELMDLAQASVHSKD